MPCSDCGDQRYCHVCELCRHCGDDGHVNCEDSSEKNCPSCGFRDNLCKICSYCEKHEKCVSNTQSDNDEIQRIISHLSVKHMKDIISLYKLSSKSSSKLNREQCLTLIEKSNISLDKFDEYFNKQIEKIRIRFLTHNAFKRMDLSEKFYKDF